MSSKFGGGYLNKIILKFGYKMDNICQRNMKKLMTVFFFCQI